MPNTEAVFILDPGHTFAYFEYNHFGFSRQTSRFDSVSGDVAIDFKLKKGSVNIQIDMKSVSTGSTLFNSHIQGVDFFNTNQFPVANFTSDEVEFEGDRISAVRGVLTIKDICEHVTLEIVHFEHSKHPITGKEHCGANAVTLVRRSDFNMGKYTPQISDDVIIKIAIEATRA